MVSNALMKAKKDALVQMKCGVMLKALMKE